MIENKKVEAINMLKSTLEVMSCFFAGYLFVFDFNDAGLLSAFLLALGIILSQVRAVPEGEMKE